MRRGCPSVGREAACTLCPNVEFATFQDVLTRLGNPFDFAGEDERASVGLLSSGSVADRYFFPTGECTSGRPPHEWS